MSFYKESSFKVVAAVIVSLTFFGAMALQVAQNPLKGLFGPSHNSYHFYLTSGQGVIVSSRIFVMGVDSGHVKNLALKDGRARVDIALDRQIVLTDQSYVALEPKGILGGQSVQVYIVMSPDAAVLKDGDEIKNVKAQNSLADLIGKLSGVMSDVKSITENVRSALDAADGKTSLSRTVRNIEKITEDLAELTADNKKQITQVITALSKTIGDPSFVESFDSFKVGLSKVEGAMAKVDSILGQVDSGQGTIGKLINDDETVENLNTTLLQASKFLGGLSRIQTKLGYHFESMATKVQPGFKHVFGAHIKPGWDREYYVGLTSDHRGVIKDRVTRESGPHGGDGPNPEIPPSGERSVNARTKSTQDIGKLRFTATFGRRYYNFILRGGAIESSGGIGLDYYAFNEKLKITFESSNFNKNYSKAFVQYEILDGVKFLTGVNDISAKPEYIDRARSSFVGFGFSLDDRDLKGLVGRFIF